MPDLSTAIQGYLVDRAAQGFARSTLRGDRFILTTLLADIGNIQVRNIGPRHISVLWQCHPKWAQSTRNTALVELSSFFKWCRRMGYMPRDCDPLEGLKTRRAAPRKRVIIPQDKFSTLLAEIPDPRHRIATAIGLYLFTRISETSALRWQDDRGTEVEVYRTKTKNLDVLPICEELREELDRWRFAYAAEVGSTVKPGWYVVPRRGTSRFQKGSPPGKGRPIDLGPLMPLQETRLSDAIRRVLIRAGYYEPFEGGHTLRRSGAIALYHRLTYMGHDRAMRVCQAMLGHANIATTEIYLRLDLDQKLRNDLLSGQPMFPDTVEADVVDLRGLTRGEKNA